MTAEEQDSTMTDAMEKAVEAALLPCPFCGGEAELISPTETDRWAQVNCKVCGCRGTEYPAEISRAIAAWNKRAALAPECRAGESPDWNGTQRPDGTWAADDPWPAQLSLKTTPAMRDRLRELTKTDGIDDYDRVVMLLLDDFASCMVMLGILADASPTRSAEGWQAGDRVLVRRALLLFTHRDLSRIAPSNTEGADSPVFQRDEAVLTLGDFWRAQLAYDQLFPAAPLVAEPEG